MQYSNTYPHISTESESAYPHNTFAPRQTGLNSQSHSLSVCPADPELAASGPLVLLTSQLPYQSGSNSATVSVELMDNSLALEQPRVVSLGIVLSSSECYDLAIAPTLITVLDDDGMCVCVFAQYIVVYV